MYNEIQGGEIVEIQGLNCNIPPVGYVYGVVSKELQYVGVYSRSDIASEQFWERTPLPEWYKETIATWDIYNRKKKDSDPEFYDEKLDAYQKEEWFRRLNGYWFMNNGKAVYLTGSHYLYLQWWQIDIGYPKFRYPDLEYFYFLQYCLEDPECFGMLEITKRRFGKTFRGGLFLYEYITRTKMTNGAIQSKTGHDGKKVFSKAVISPFKKLPRFFRPEYDMSLGITPKTEIRFQQTNVRGKKAEETLDREELGSMIDWGSADPIHYDGQKIHRGFHDEWAKTTECNIYDRWDVFKYCLLNDEGKIIGKALFSSTVEKLDTERDGIQKAAKTLWDDSNQLEKKENGRTASGLYRFFMTADKGRNIDKYGVSDENKTITEILADRSAVSHNIRALSNLIKKEARTIEEAFRTDADNCLFNTEKLEERRSLLSYHKDLIEKGNFIWKDGIRDSEVIWCPDKNGRWDVVKEFLYDFIKERKRVEEGREISYYECNATEKRGNMFIPKNDWRFGGAVDPYDHDTVQDNRRSMAASLIKQKTNTDNFEGKFNWCDVCKYLARPATAELMYEDILIQHFFFSCKMLPETQKPGIMRYFRNRGYASFLMVLPGYTEPGIPSTPENKQTGCEFVEYDVETRIDKYYFIDVIENLLELDIKKTQPFDLGMAKLWTEVACLNKLYERKPDNKVVEIGSIFKQYKTKVG